jgi:muconate cycloisomerase
MQLSVQPFTVHPPSIASVTPDPECTSLWVMIEQDGIEGWGEATPFTIGTECQNIAELSAIARRLRPEFQQFSAWERQKVTAFLEAHHVPSALRASIDVALWDWLGKAVNLPLWKLWGLDTRWLVPPSIRVDGLSSELAQLQLKNSVTAVNARYFKVHLGSPEGIAADQQLFQALQAIAPAQSRFSIDAHGAWNLEDAMTMADWLAHYAVDYLEQPLPPEQGILLPQLQHHSPLPIFVDESCCYSQDVLALEGAITGITIKLMKCGGLTEAQRMIQVAQLKGFKIALSCYSVSALGNSAIAQLAAFADYLNLTDHLAVNDDPFQGVSLTPQGHIQLSSYPGIGVRRE